MSAPGAAPADPYLEDRHRALADKVRAFGDKHLRGGSEDEAHPGARTRELAQLLAQAGLLGYAIPAPHGAMDVRSLAVIREGLSYFSSLADSAFAMQGLGSHPVARAGTGAQRDRWLPAAATGDVLCAFAITEPEAGSDVGAIRTAAARDGALWRLTGLKTFISNAGIAGMYTVLARTGGAESEPHRSLSMFLVDAEAPDITVKALEAMAPHPLGEVRFAGTPGVLVGEEGHGHSLAMKTLDTFRPSVGAAAVGLAARALDEASRWAQARRQFGKPLAELQGVQMALAEMQTELQAARLLVRHAAWTKDQGAEKVAREGAMAKLFATEAAQRIVDRAVQIHGGQGVMRGATVERLYREVRALRIYEGTSEILKLVIAREMAKESR
jgi:acyl-CoA dehydrogenase